MKISSISNCKLYHNNFKRNQDNHIEKQVKQVLYENFEDINTQTVNRAKEEIEKKYLPQFKKELVNEKGYISSDDMKTIFSTLADVYKKAGIEKDATILNNIFLK